MKHLFLLAGVAMLSACGTRDGADSNAAAAANEAVANDSAAVNSTADLASLNGTSWTFTREGKQVQESIDENGNYIANAGEEHLDHGTYAMVDGKQCFTSAMTDEGQVCWTVPGNVDVGGSADISSDKGERLTVTRIEYVPMTMPS